MPITEAGRWSLRFAQNIRRKKDNEDFAEQIGTLVSECAESSVEHRSEVPMTVGQTADCFLFSDDSRLAYFAVGTEENPAPWATTYTITPPVAAPVASEGEDASAEGGAAVDPKKPAARGR